MQQAPPRSFVNELLPEEEQEYRHSMLDRSKTRLRYSSNCIKNEERVKALEGLNSWRTRSQHL